MVDLEKDKGNISLPSSLQSPDLKHEKKKVLPDHMIINMQKAFYDLKINEINKRIQRLQERNDELINDQEETALILTTADVETAEEIAQLTKQLFDEVTKLEELKKKLNALEKAIVDNKLAHIEKVNCINDKYAKKRLELTSQIKPINAQTNVLEDYRKSQSILQEKLERINDFMLKEEEKVNQQIHQIDLKFKVDREKLKKDMYKRLLDLAGTFQLEISACIQEPIHKLIRENIILNTYLTQIMNDSLPKKDNFKKSKHTKELLLKRNKFNYLAARHNIKIANIQDHILESLNEVHKDAKRRLARFRYLNMHNEEKYTDDRDLAQIKINNFEAHVRELEVMLFQERVRLSATKYLQQKIQCKIKKCADTLYDIKYAVICALQMKNSDPCFARMDSKNFFLHLQNIILEGETCMSNIIAQSVESIPQSTDVYTYGDLGFEPLHIELKRPIQMPEKSIMPEFLSTDRPDVQSKEVLKDKSSTIFQTPTDQDFSEDRYLDIEESIGDELDQSEMTNNGSTTELLED